MGRVTRVFIALMIVLTIAVLAMYWYGGRERQFESEVAISATQLLVFEFLTDPQRIKSLEGGGARIQPLTDGGHQVGARFHVSLAGNGLPLNVETEVLESQPNERLITMLESSRFSGRSDFKLTTRGQATVLQHTLKVQPKGWARFVAPFSQTQVQTAIDRGLEQLKRRIEREASGQLLPPPGESE
jgi:uncharacterized protein YndB with AHSA1/START domain